MPSFTLGEIPFPARRVLRLRQVADRQSRDVGGCLPPRDASATVAWNFFYGIVNFDGVVGTVNHYGTVDLFAGATTMRTGKAEMDHVENFQSENIKATFEGMLADWTNASFRSVRPRRKRRAVRLV